MEKNNHDHLPLVKIKSGNFRDVYNRGEKCVGGKLILFFLPGGEEQAFASVASRKIGNAVVRNRAKRLLREAFRTMKGRLQKPGAYILLARAGIRGSSCPQVQGELEKLLTRLNLF
jgi:ribonuclease P protein component